MQRLSLPTQTDIILQRRPRKTVAEAQRTPSSYISQIRPQIPPAMHLHLRVPPVLLVPAADERSTRERRTEGETAVSCRDGSAKAIGT